MLQFRGVASIPIPSGHAAAVRSRGGLRAKQGSRYNPCFMGSVNTEKGGWLGTLKLELSAAHRVYSQAWRNAGAQQLDKPYASLAGKSLILKPVDDLVGPMGRRRLTPVKERQHLSAAIWTILSSL